MSEYLDCGLRNEQRAGVIVNRRLRCAVCFMSCNLHMPAMGVNGIMQNVLILSFTEVCVQLKC
jgi:hypothetical protein